MFNNVDESNNLFFTPTKNFYEPNLCNMASDKNYLQTFKYASPLSRNSSTQKKQIPFILDKFGSLLNSSESSFTYFLKKPEKKEEPKVDEEDDFVEEKELEEEVLPKFEIDLKPSRNLLGIFKKLDKKKFEVKPTTNQVNQATANVVKTASNVSKKFPRVKAFFNLTKLNKKKNGLELNLTRRRKTKEQLNQLNAFYRRFSRGNKKWTREQILALSLKVKLNKNIVYKWLWDRRSKEEKKKIFVVFKQLS